MEDSDKSKEMKAKMLEVLLTRSSTFEKRRPSWLERKPASRLES